MKKLFTHQRVIKIAKAVWIICAVLLSFTFLAQQIVVSMLRTLFDEQQVQNWLMYPGVLLSMTVLIYVTAIGILWVGYRLLRIQTDFVADTRITHLPKSRGIMLAFMALAGYAVTTMVVGMLARVIFPEANWEQTQQLGYEQTNSIVELIIIGLALVVAAPVMEEIIFRGIMFSGVRRFVGANMTVLLTAVAFGVAHGQLNVSLDTFVLGLFLGYLRAETNSIWPSITLHMLKNFIAYMALFVLWPWTSVWLQG